MASKDEKFDPVLLSLAQQLEGGVPQLLDVLFGFLRRKTGDYFEMKRIFLNFRFFFYLLDFYTGGEPGAAQKMVNTAFEKHQNLAEKDKKRRENEKLEEEKRRKQEEEKKKKQEEEEEKTHKVVEITEEEEHNILKEKQMKEEAKTNKAEEEKKPINEESTSKGSEEDEGKGLPPNSGNGSQTDKYKWTQTLSEVEVRIPIKPGSKRDLVVEIKSNKLKVAYKGQAPFIEGEWYKKVKADDCYWIIEDSQLLVLTLHKVNGMEWWACLLIGEPEINTRKISPENSRLDDLDGETRATVEKLMFDQQQKQKGLPTSDDLQKQQLLQKFMQQHPEMDFSKAKIG